MTLAVGGTAQRGAQVQPNVAEETRRVQTQAAQCVIR